MILGPQIPKFTDTTHQEVPGACTMQQILYSAHEQQDGCRQEFTNVIERSFLGIKEVYEPVKAGKSNVKEVNLKGLRQRSWHPQNQTMGDFA